MKDVCKDVFEISDEIRYVAIYQNGILSTSTKAELANASASESDRYEELLVNPTLLTLVKQRGNIDCGGAEYILIRYGNFYQYVMPIQNGHISIAINKNADPLMLAKQIRSNLRDWLHGTPLE